MKEIVYKQDAIDALLKLGDSYFGEDEVKRGIAQSQRVIYELPSAELEIIHCKDCRWSVEHYDTDGNVPYWICNNWDSGTDADGFCYEAERRTE